MENAGKVRLRLRSEIPGLHISGVSEQPCSTTSLSKNTEARLCLRSEDALDIRFVPVQKNTLWIHSNGRVSYVMEGIHVGRP